jgi:hypothetical protein
MSHDCHFILRASGGHTELAQFSSLLLSDAEITHGRWVMDFEKHLQLPGLQQWCWLHDLKFTQADVEIRAWTRYNNPPRAAVYELSLAWPDLTFELSYDYDNDVGFQKWQFMAGADTLLQYSQGYFTTAKPGDPVHHRWAFVGVPGDPDAEKAIRRDLRAKGVFLTVPKPDEPAFSLAGVTRWADAEIAAYLEKNFRGPFEFAAPSVPFTLHEPEYVSSLRGISGKTPEEMRELYRIAERDVALTADELLWLAERRHFESVYHDNLMKEEYQHRFCPFLSDERLGQLCEGAGPRALELKFLIELYGKDDHARAAKLQRALRAPRWADRWPLWEQHERRVKEEEAALAEIWAGSLLPYEQAEPLLKAKGLDPGPRQYDERVRKEAESRGVPPPVDEDQVLAADFLAELGALESSEGA